MDTARLVIEARSLTKKYNGLTAVKGIDFDIKAKECFGFLGPNGAGKTTTVKMIQCFSPITSGYLSVLGYEVTENPRKIKSLIGIVPQEDNLDLELTVWENLMVYARYFRLPKEVARERSQKLLEFAALESNLHTRVDELSGGMKRRLTIARSLVNQPRLLILDEPTTGLDPQARHLIWQRLRQLKKEGVTLLLTTHYLEEASQLCDRLIIMDRGQILEQGNPQDLIEKHIGREIIEIGPCSTHDVGEVLQLVGEELKGYQHVADNLFLYPLRVSQLCDRLRDLPEQFAHQFQRPATLEDVFLKLAGRGLESWQEGH